MTYVWTTARPTASGWYFFRDGLLTSGSTKVVQALQYEGNGKTISHIVLGGGGCFPIEHLDGTAQFAGPIHAPIDTDQP